MTTRREAREQAFCLVFEMDFQNYSMEEIIEHANECRDLEVDSYAAQLAYDVAGNRQELDEMISTFSTKWKVERLSRVSRALLRMAVAEIRQGNEDVPVGVSINEAVELAKQYGGDEDAPFVNGVLGAYARSLEKSEAK